MLTSERVRPGTTARNRNQAAAWIRCNSCQASRRVVRPAVAQGARALTSIVALVPQGATSPYNGAAWTDVVTLVKERIAWEGRDLALSLFTFEDVISNELHQESMLAEAAAADVFLAVQATEAAEAEVVREVCKTKRPVSLVLDSSQEVEALSSLAGVPIKRVPVAAASWLSRLPLPLGRALKSWVLLQELWSRRTSDDLVFMVLLAVNDFVKPIPSTHVNQGDLQSLWKMCTLCRNEIVACLQNPECKKALDGLAQCGLNDQVCSYRVIASYETPELENFSKCILQKHNCLGNAATIPFVPSPTPLGSFRGHALTHEAAEDIFIGHLSSSHPSPKPFSWRVAAGKNAAYDFFPCQFQLWYRAKGKIMWYDPIFKVETLDGPVVWRRRHYRVRRDALPGTFNFSVLDNGVTSNEFWRIMDCAEDLSWAVFYYSGAASAAGIAYRGALVCTPSGQMPDNEEVLARINGKLQECGIRLWEMYTCNNNCCDDAPLSVPDYGSVEYRELSAFVAS